MSAIPKFLPKNQSYVFRIGPSKPKSKTHDPIQDCSNSLDLVRRSLPRGRKKLLRKEVIQPQVPLRLPCYDFTPVTDHSLGRCLPCGLEIGRAHV